MVNSQVPNRGKAAVTRAAGEWGTDVRPKQRQALVLDVIEREGDATVDALAVRFGVSPETIRREE